MNESLRGLICLAIGLFFAFNLWSGLRTGRLKLRARAVERALTPVWFWVNAGCYALAALVGLGAGVMILRSALAPGS